MVQENVLVTGTTGKVGRMLVGLLAERGSHVMAGSRSPETARELVGDAADDDVEVVELDYERTATWDEAVQWSDRVFLVPAPFDPHQYETLVPFLDWAVASGTRHVVLLSALPAGITDDLHLRTVEQHVEKTGVAWTFLRPNWLMQNFSQGYVLECVRKEDSFVLPAGDGAVSFVDARDVARAAAEVLTSDEHFGAAYGLTGPEALDHDAAAAVLSEVLDRPIRYEAVSEEHFRGVLAERERAPAEAEVILTAYRSMREGRRSDVTTAVEDLTGRPPTSFRRFVEEHAAVWRD